MAKLRRVHVLGQNRLLAALPGKEYDRLRPHLVKVSLRLREILYEPSGPIPYVYFPLEGVVSLVLMMEGGFALEVGIIGNEGIVGTPVFLGFQSSLTRAISQVPGDALRMETTNFQEEMLRRGAMYGLVQRSTQAMINQISQSTVCNHRHSVKKRLCRWLLMSHDRVGTDEFPLTHEFLAQMLGVRRPTVTAAAGSLQTAGLIRYRRGRVTVLDRKGMEAAGCECYRVVAEELDRLLD